MSNYQPPRQRKGFILRYVHWNRDGTVRNACYEPIGKAAPDHVPDTKQKVGPRSALAAERPTQDDLFGSH